MIRSKILLVDDEPDLVELLKYNLEKEGYEVFTASAGRRAIELAHKTQPDLIILDVMMPEMDGIEVCETLRKVNEFRLTPILMLTARAGEDNEVAGLEAGADDYLIKPISPRVLKSRVKAQLRRTEPKEVQVIKILDLEIDREQYEVRQESADGIEIRRLPRKEFELLSYLALSPGKVFTRAILLDEVWGQDVYVVDRTVDVHIRKIREKLGSAYIETVKGIGYKFKAV